MDYILYLIAHPFQFAALMWIGFIYYSAILRLKDPLVAKFKDAPWWLKVLMLVPATIGGAPCLPFWLIDVLWRFTFGALLMGDIDHRHGWTFSQLLCYWYRIGEIGKLTGSWRYIEARIWSLLLNFAAPLHIS